MNVGEANYFIQYELQQWHFVSVWATVCSINLRPRRGHWVWEAITTNLSKRCLGSPTNKVILTSSEVGSWSDAEGFH